MKGHSLTGWTGHGHLAAYCLLVLAFSIPIWILGPFVERFLPGALPTDLPISSLMTIVPILAAVVVVRREGGSRAVKALLRRAFDAKRIQRTRWYLPVFLLLPTMMAVQLGWARLSASQSLNPRVPFLMVLASFAVFIVAALGEEVGWHGYAIELMQARWNALAASIMLGAFWAAWHIIPLTQMDRTPSWIAWQAMNLLVSRILYGWIYNASGKSVFATILFHAMHNVSTVLLPAYGWPYDPRAATAILAAVSVLVTLLWGPRTFSRFRFHHRGRDVQPAAVS